MGDVTEKKAYRGFEKLRKRNTELALSKEEDEQLLKLKSV
jgi:hypothetical protein